MYALVYVDDILITRSSFTLVYKLIDSLHTTFALKNLGTPKYFLSIEIKRVSIGGLILTKTKYICDLLSRAKMWNANGTLTLMLPNCKLSKNGMSLLSDPRVYLSILGALQYVLLLDMLLRLV